MRELEQVINAQNSAAGVQQKFDALTRILDDIEGDDMGTLASQSLVSEIHTININLRAIRRWLLEAESTLRESP